MSSSVVTNGVSSEPHAARPRRRDAGAEIAAIAASGLFDAACYARASGAKGNERDLIRHFLEHGEAELLSPSDEFDVAFYRHTNPDVAAAGVNSLLHYLEHGAAEGRYPNRRSLAVDVAKVQHSGLFDTRQFARYYSLVHSPGLTELEYYLTSRTENMTIGSAFDEPFYCSIYDDVRRYPRKPLLHYIEVGIPESRIRTRAELSDRKSACGKFFDAAFYLSQLASNEQPDDPLEHYLLIGSRSGLAPSPDFSADYYTRRYPDLGTIDPFYHYCLHGRGEGRVARLHLSEWFLRGPREYDVRKKTVLIASHEASRTGAPLVGLMLAARLSERYNVIVSLGKGGPLRESFVRYACLYTIAKPSPLDAEFLLKELRKTYGLDAILLNSVETNEFAPAALYAEIPSLALLHEFAEYTLPAGRMSAVVEAVDRIIVPAALLRKSLQTEVEFHRGNSANNVVVRPQGYLPHPPPDEKSGDLSREQILSLLDIDDPERTHIVLGAGYVQMRKGIDLFVQTAAEMRTLVGDNVRFVWVGAGYEPTADLAYSAWVADMVRRLELEDYVFFLPPQASLDLLFELAHVFYLPSRLDPFPNVVLDAFIAGKAVVCFDRATGVAEDIDDGKAHGAAVPYCDVRRAAEALARAITPPAREAARANLGYARERHDFDDYVEFIERQLEIAMALRSELIATARRIEASGNFDAAFHDGTRSGRDRGSAWRSILDYTARGSKGLLRYNPRLGLNEGAYRWRVAGAADAGGPALDPLGLDPTAAGPPATHRCVELDERKPAPPYDGRVALHLHLHYPELADWYVEQLTEAECAADVFVTTTSPHKRLEIQYAFRNYAFGGVQVIDSPNRGRDIGPLLSTLKLHLRSGGFDVVGHLHGKRSLAVDSAMGERWNRYLIDTLIGSRDNLRRILALFANEPELGLVFAEDRHCVGWTKNKPFAERLAADLVPRPALPDFPVFPLGTMFWARPAVLEPLWQRGFESSSFPVEPLPYDGSMLHAVERMLPSIAESTGHSWCTVYRPDSGW